MGTVALGVVFSVILKKKNEEDLNRKWRNQDLIFSRKEENSRIKGKTEILCDDGETIKM